MKIVFMGTPDFAVGALEALIAAGYEVTAVVTQPDKAKGRSGQLQAPPVKECAVRHGIPVMQPRRIKTPEAIAELKQYSADVYIVAAFGQILSQEILDMPKFGSLNIHASLLPKYRGASPIQHVIIDGEAETGVTIMQMDSGIDTGDMLYKKSIPIAKDDTYETLHDKLMVLGGEAIVEALPLLEAGKLVPEKQDNAQSCHAPLIEKQMGRIDFAKDAFVIDRQIRGMTPWPSTYTTYKGKQMKIWRAVPVSAAGGTEEKLQIVAADAGRAEIAGKAEIAATAAERLEIAATDAGRAEIAAADKARAEKFAVSPGTVLRVDKDCICVACGENELCIYELQLEGKKRMSTHDFLLGVKVQPGERLGE